MEEMGVTAGHKVLEMGKKVCHLRLYKQSLGYKGYKGFMLCRCLTLILKGLGH